MVQYAGFIGPSVPFLNRPVDVQRTVNMYVDMDETGYGKGGIGQWLRGTPGTKKILTFPTNPVRGVFSDPLYNLWVVSGDTLYQVIYNSNTGSWTQNAVGTLLTQTGSVGMSCNGTAASGGNQLIIVDGPYGYIYNFFTGVFTQITDVNFLGSPQVRFQNQYFFLYRPNSSTFYISNIDNGLSYNPLYFGAMGQAPDRVNGIMDLYGQMWVFGYQHTEVWYDNPNAVGSQFPYNYYPNSSIDTGCMSAFSIAKLNDKVFWLGQNTRGKALIVQGTPYQVITVSTKAISTLIQSFSDNDLNSAVAYTYQEDGHSFYVINFSEAQRTLVYDIEFNLWHERSYLNNGQQQRQRGQYYTSANGFHILGDYASGDLYISSTDIYTDFGNPIQRIRQGPFITVSDAPNPTLEMLFFSYFKVDLQVGIDNPNSAVAGEQTYGIIVIEYSDDGGRTWVGYEPHTLGVLGEYYQTVWVTGLGQSRGRAFRTTITSPVPVAIMGAYYILNSGVK